MPQFDTFIFSSSLFYFIISFFAVLYLNYTKFLPRISSLLKLRFKILKNASTSNEKVENLVTTKGDTFFKFLSSYKI